MYSQSLSGKNIIIINGVFCIIYKYKILKTTIYVGRTEFLFLCSLHLCKKISVKHGIFLLIPHLLTVAFTAVQIYLGIHISLQDQSLLYLAVGFVDPFFLNFVWAHNYMPNIEKNVKKEIDFNFKLQRSSDNKNVGKMMKKYLGGCTLVFRDNTLCSNSKKGYLSILSFGYC